jgi:hypothetical protein
MPEVLHFKSTRDAFEYAREFMPRPLVEGAELIGYVDALSDESGYFIVTVVTAKGLLQSPDCFSVAGKFSGRDPVAGDLVMVTPISLTPNSGQPPFRLFIPMILTARLLMPEHKFEPLIKSE